MTVFGCFNLTTVATCLANLVGDKAQPEQLIITHQFWKLVAFRGNRIFINVCLKDRLSGPCPVELGSYTRTLFISHLSQYYRLFRFNVLFKPSGFTTTVSIPPKPAPCLVRFNLPWFDYRTFMFEDNSHVSSHYASLSCVQIFSSVSCSYTPSIRFHLESEIKFHTHKNER